MQPHEQRVINEKAELDERIQKLNAFVRGDVFFNLAYIEQMRLCRQLTVMREYSTILYERIANFPRTTGLDAG